MVEPIPAPCHCADPTVEAHHLEASEQRQAEGPKEVLELRLCPEEAAPNDAPDPHHQEQKHKAAHYAGNAPAVGTSMTRQKVQYFVPLLRNWSGPGSANGLNKSVSLSLIDDGS